MSRIIAQEDRENGRILLVLPGVKDEPTKAEFYPLQRPVQYAEITPDQVRDGVKRYVGTIKCVRQMVEHFTATLLEMTDEGIWCTNGHEFVVSPTPVKDAEYDRPGLSVFHSLVVFVENADDALYRAQKEAEYIAAELQLGREWEALEKVFPANDGRVAIIKTVPK